MKIKVTKDKDDYHAGSIETEIAEGIKIKEFPRYSNPEKAALKTVLSLDVTDPIIDALVAGKTVIINIVG